MNATVSGEDLLDELGSALELVGMLHSYEDPLPKTIELAVRKIQGLHAELSRRGINYHPCIEQLAARRQWRAEELLGDCLAFPERLPYVVERDGIRRALRCLNCNAAEYPPGASVFRYCNKCMEHVLAAVREHTPCEGHFVFRSYSAAVRCSHADADTVLVCPLCTANIVGVCERCIEDELKRREQG